MKGPSDEMPGTRDWQDQPRVDIVDKVTGRSAYVEDMPEPTGTLHADAIRSAYSHAKINAIDSSRAERLPGVAAILHHGNAHEFQITGASSSWRQQFIAADHVRFDGDLVWMVLAEGERTARQAVELVEIEYEILSPLFDASEALRPEAQLIHEDLDSNLALSDLWEWGDIAAGLRQADVVLTETYSCTMIYQHPMEPASSFIVDFSGDILDVWAPTNTPFEITETANAVFGWPKERFRIVLSRRVRRPVKLRVSGVESFRTTARHAFDITITLGLKADGTITALDEYFEINTGAYFTGARIATGNAETAAWGAYRVPHFRVRAHTAYTNRVPAGGFRNTGKNQPSFAVDSMLDDAARRIGMRPLDLQLKNLLDRGEGLPTDTWKRNGRMAPARVLPMDSDVPELIKRAMEAIGWDGPTPRAYEPGERVSRGRGLAISRRRGSGMGNATALASVDQQGVVTISH
ncbi:MAG: molybdopterin-dependent oxidoreductase [Chloroflexi bacterium]|nr:molybdopterin-dependent oxidoreductase [Chloroflexota bacterium]